MRLSEPKALRKGRCDLASISMKELLEAGVHFGHQTKRWNPKMKKYIFGKRNGIYIIDLQKTLKQFKEASKFVTDLAAAGKNLLFVGTKRQAQDAIYEEANRCGMFYVNTRWLGGTLTNFSTIRKSIHRLKEIEGILAQDDNENLTKKERLRLEREKEKLEKNLTGIKEMDELPDALFVIDPEAGVHRGQGSEHPRHPGGGRRRHQLRPGPGRPRHPGQRRRHPRHPALHRRRSPTRCSRGCTPTGSARRGRRRASEDRPRTPELSQTAVVADALVRTVGRRRAAGVRAVRLDP